MLSNVLLVLPLIPLKLKFAHIYIICTLCLFVKTESHMSTAGISCGRARRPGEPARRALRRRRDSSGSRLHAELGLVFSLTEARRPAREQHEARPRREQQVNDRNAPAKCI